MNKREATLSETEIRFELGIEEFTTEVENPTKNPYRDLHSGSSQAHQRCIGHLSKI